MTGEAHGVAPIASAGEIAAEAGLVLLDGPSGLVVALTPDAAEEMAELLAAAAEEARRQVGTRR